MMPSSHNRTPPYNAASAWRGAWNPTAAYNVGDWVTYANAVYIAQVGNVDLAPTHGGASWTRVVNGSSSPGTLSPVMPSWLWVKADAGLLTSTGAACPQGGGVATWKDQSGNGHDLTVPLGGTAPTLLVSQETRLPGVFFGDAVTDELANLVNPATGHTSLVIANWNPVGTAQMWGDGAEWEGIYAGEYSLYQTGQALLSGVGQDASLHLHAFYTGGLANPNGFLQVDNNPAQTVNGMNAYTSFHISNHVTQPFTGYVYEIMVWNQQLTPAQIALAGTYLLNKWGF